MIVSSIIIRSIIYTQNRDKITANNRFAISHSLRIPGISTSRIEFTLESIRTSNMHTGNFESAALPSNLRQDGVYMTNDRIPYAKKSTLPRRFLSLASPLALSTLILFIPAARAHFGYTYNAARASFFLSRSLARVISYPQRYYERACNGNRRMIHGDVKRDGSRCRLETQSLPIREQPMPWEERDRARFLFW